jgi:hypothetical protein
MTYTFQGTVYRHNSGWSGVLVIDERIPNSLFWLPRIHPIHSKVYFEVSVVDKEPEE